MGKLKIVLYTVAASAVATALQLGTYDYMRTKKGMGRWKAGLASGALVSSIGVAVLYFTGGLDAAEATLTAPTAPPATAGLGYVIPQQIGGIYVSPYKGLSGIVARKVAGY